MAGQEIDVILGILIHTPSFWNDITDVFVIFLQTPFLVGYVRITVKNFCPQGAGFILLDVPWVLKFRAIVSKDDRKILFKRPYPYGIAEVVDGIDHAFLCAVRKQNDDHEGAASKHQSKQTFAFIPAAFYSIHFDNVKFRESICIFLEVDVGPFVAVHLLDIWSPWICTLLRFL